MNAKIGRFQLFSIMLMGRTFSECLNIPNEVSVYEMQRFTVIFLSRIVFLLLCLPMITLSYKYPEENFFTIIHSKSKAAGWVVFGFLSAHLLFIAVLLAVKFEVYVQNTIMSTASSYVLIGLFFLAVFYGVIKGVQAVMRAGSVLVVIFAAFLAVLSIALIPKINLNYLYPVLIEKPDTFMPELLSETVKNTEIYIFLIFCSGTAKKPTKIMPFVILFSLIVVEYMHFTYVTILGQYLDSVSFPFYTNASLADVIILDRLDGLDMIIWTITSVLEVAVIILCIKAMLLVLLAEKVKIAETITMSFTFLAGIISIFGTLDRSAVADMYSVAYMGVTLLIFVVAFPAAALFLLREKKGKDNNEKNPLPVADSK